MPERIEAEIVDKETYTERLATFELNPGEEIEFTPGQFMMVGTDIDGQFKKRAYSIVSTPGSEPMEFCIKKAPDGKGNVAPHILEMGDGDELEMEGPYGKFLLQETDEPKLFVAAGTGIAPIVCMIRSLKNNGFEGPIHLFYGVSYPETFIYDEEFRQLSREMDDFTFVPTVSRDVPDWEGEEGRVENVLPDYLEELPKGEAYTCGPPPMVQNVEEMLKENGWQEDDLHKEQYW